MSGHETAEPTEAARDVVVSPHEARAGSLALYVSGFVLSVLLTLAAYLAARHQVWGGRALAGALLGLGVVQLFVQLVCFLHLGRGSNARWNLALLGFMLMVVLIVVVGSLWIMYNLNYRMTPQQMRQYLNSQDSL